MENLTNTNIDTNTETDINTINGTNTEISDNNDVETTNEVLTVEQVQKMIQSENDKIRTEYSKKLKAKEKEIEEVRKSSMSEQEKLDYENKTLQEQLIEREQALLEKEQAYERTNLELKTVDLLKEHLLPLEAKDFLVGTDIDSTQKNIEAFKSMFDNAIENEVKQRIKGTTKEHKEVAIGGSITKEQFGKLTYAERSELFKTNPELYKELTK